MTELGVHTHPHSGLHQLRATMFTALLCALSGAGCICTARRSLPAPPCTSSSRLQPRQLTSACISWCAWLLREQWLYSWATFTRLILYTHTPWTDLAALSLWCVASARSSPAGKKKRLYEMPLPPKPAVRCSDFIPHVILFMLVSSSHLTSRCQNACLLYLPLAKASPTASWSENPGTLIPPHLPLWGWNYWISLCGRTHDKWPSLRPGHHCPYD